MDIDQLLTPLREIDRVEDATIIVHFNLRFGQEWLPRVLDDIINQMKKSGSDQWSAYSFLRTRICREAYKRTCETIGSEVCGHLSKLPTEYLSTISGHSSDSEWSDTTSKTSDDHEEIITLKPEIHKSDMKDVDPYCHQHSSWQCLSS